MSSDYVAFSVDLSGDEKELQAFLLDPELLLVQKLRSSEVSYGKLAKVQQKLFDASKAKEVSQFIKTKALRARRDKIQEQKAWPRGRIMKARRVLSWKPIPPEERDEPIEAAADGSDPTMSPDGTRKAKARTVIVGLQHPDFGNPKFKTTSPVVSQHNRAWVFELAAFHQRRLESCDATTAFLQGKSKEESNRTWTTSVSDLAPGYGQPWFSTSHPTCMLSMV